MSTYQIHPLLGRTFASVTHNGFDRVTFKESDGTIACEFWYQEDCCATCTVEDIAGDLDDLAGSPITMAEYSCSDKRPSDSKVMAPCPERWDHESPETCSACKAYEDAEITTDESNTWTFVKLATAKGYVTLRWFGSSNGYYSERPSFQDCSAARESKVEYKRTRVSVSEFYFTPWNEHTQTLGDEDVIFKKDD